VFARRASRGGKAWAIRKHERVSMLWRSRFRIAHAFLRPAAGRRTRTLLSWRAPSRGPWRVLLCVLCELHVKPYV